MGIFIGFLIGVGINIFENRKYNLRLEAAGGKLPPEARLPLAAWGGVLMPAGLFVFAWTAVPESIHWSVPILATIPFGVGMLLVFLSTTNYLVDAYLMYAASCLAANAVLRSMFGAVFPLFTARMFAELGVNWALTLVAFLSLACAPVRLFLRLSEFMLTTLISIDSVSLYQIWTSDPFSLHVRTRTSPHPPAIETDSRAVELGGGSLSRGFTGSRK